MKNIMTFKEYDEFTRVASDERYKNNVTFYDPQEGWVIHLKRKFTPLKEKKNS